MKHLASIIASTFVLSAGVAFEPAFAEHSTTEEKEITFIHTGDTHGDFHPHVNTRDNQPSEGGLARVATVVKQIRADAGRGSSFHVHTGDTIMGGAEVLFTRGQAMVDVLNEFGIDVFTSGNWEFVYGVERFRELFLGANGNAPLAPWGLVTVNAYYNGDNPAYNAQADKQPGMLVTPPYRVETINGVKVGMFGCTTNRGPQIVGPNVVKGVSFSDCKGTIKTGTPTQPLNKPIKFADGTTTTTVAHEIKKYVDILRNVEKVDVVIMLSEAGLAENIFNAENNSGIDLIFSSDMHEETNYPVQVSTPNGGTTWVVEQGEDGAQVGEVKLKLVKNAGDANYTIEKRKWKEHDITDDIHEDLKIAKLIEEVTAPFNGKDFVPGKFRNPFNDAPLMQPLDTVIGTTQVGLSRNNYSHMWDPANGVMPGLVEGTGHALIADAFRAMTGSQIGAIRGFRYVNDFPAGSTLTLGDLYHYMSIGPQVARAKVSAQVINNSSENAANSIFDPDVTKWAGGWMFNYSGVTIDLDPYKTNVQPSISLGRVFNIKVGRTSIYDTTSAYDLLDDNPVNASGLAPQQYSYASYYYQTEPSRVNAIPTVAGSIQVLVATGFDANGAPTGFAFAAPGDVQYSTWNADGTLATRGNAVDAVDVVAAYIGSLPNATVTRNNLPFPRINLTAALPDTRPSLGFPTVEPVWGARAPGTAAYEATYGQVNYTPDEYDQD